MVVVYYQINDLFFKEIIMSRVAEVGWFDWPVGCPKPASTVQPTRKYVEDWLNQNKDKVSVFERTSYGTYAGAIALAVGAIGSVFGFAKDNKIAKWVGSTLALIGAVATLIGKFCGIEFNVIHNLHNKVLFKANTKIDETQIKKEGIEDKEILIDVPGTKNEKLHGYYLPSPIKTDKAVIYLHGRSHNNGNSASACLKIQEHVPVNVLMADYRGFGKSAGVATPESVVQDAEIMYNHLIQQGFKPENITIYGHSLGGAIAIELASRLKKKVRNLIIQSSFASVEEVTTAYKKKYLYFIPDLITKLLNRITPNVFDSKETIKNIDPETRLLILHGLNDEYIPVKQSNELFENASTDKKQIIVLQDVKHNDFCDHLDTNPQYITELKKFLGIEENVEVSKDEPSEKTA